MLLETQLGRFIEKLKRAGHLPLRLVLWNGRQIDFAAQPAITLRLASIEAARYLLMPNMARLGEAYVEGHIEVEGPVREAIRVAEGLSRSPAARESWRPFWRRTTRHSKQRDAQAIEYHYDVSNDFYSLWLDRNMVYSCAYFKTGREDIHTAQEQKLDHICRKLMLEPGEKFLDIGCGWGGLIRWAAKHYGADATGITLSRRQYEYAQARIEAEGLKDRCRVLLQDYRDLPGEGQFDKIASVGMFEHVGLKNLSVYFGAIHRLLREGGLVMNHGITSIDPDSGEVGLGIAEFIDRYVFPHGELPHLSLAIQQMARQCLEVTDVESLRNHYALTLHHWLDQLEQNSMAAKAIAGDRRFRIWLLYLAGCSHAFEHDWVTIYQILATKTGKDGVSRLPWTREYMYAPSHAGRKAKA